MKSEIRVVPHDYLPGHSVVEVVYDGKLVCTVTGADGPGVRVVSKHTPTIEQRHPGEIIPGAVEILFS